jgi:hypothetical protein
LTGTLLRISLAHINEKFNGKEEFKVHLVYQLTNILKDLLTPGFSFHGIIFILGPAPPHDCKIAACSPRSTSRERGGLSGSALRRERKLFPQQLQQTSHFSWSKMVPAAAPEPNIMAMELGNICKPWPGTHLHSLESQCLLRLHRELSTTV